MSEQVEKWGPGEEPEEVVGVIARADYEELVIEDELLDHLATDEGAMLLHKEQFSIDLVNEGDREVRDVLQFTMAFIREHKRPPGAGVLEYEFGIEFKEPRTPCGYIIERFRENYARRRAKEAIKKVARRIAEEPMMAVEQAMDEFAALRRETASRKTTMDVTDWDAQMHSYNERVLAGEFNGITFGWSEIDAVLGGLRKGCLYFVIGRPKRYKSWMLMQSAVEAQQEYNKRTVFFTLEMTLDEMFGRYLCMCAQIPYHHYMHGTLSPEDKKALEWAKNYIENLDGRVIFQRPPVGERTVPQMQQIALDLGAEAVYCDQLKYIRTNQGHQSDERHRQVEYICEELKEAADDVPWYVAAQFNREAASMQEMGDLSKIGLSDAIGQHADMLLGLYMNREMQESKIVEFGTIESRSFEHARWDIKVNLSQDSSFTLKQRKD